MTTLTMKKFDYETAFNKRFEPLDFVKENMTVTVDKTQTYKVVKTIIPKNREACLPIFVLMPIKQTLEEHKAEYDSMAKKNPFTMEIGNYPDFSFEVFSTWFFSRNVTF